ncbi:YHS domain-containing protein [Sphingobium sp. Ant17]|jgi:Cu+-exporting ATPase|uniref:YHS domain-containing protein n=1 Tax=Sphingobium sp. Ant17 TaxID=1461752 RepID=UPI00044FA40C|nr:hypothetical protein BF95_02810 [Sphingobium sp. Ant17]|tara:strand:+ start:4271 stop:4789 length:519 start_codon:yes stop_codon:yes gene_type:complete
MSESKSTPHAGHDHSCCAAPANARAKAGGPDYVTDPVCGMSVDPNATPHHADHDGQTYHFCSPGCRSKFVANPRAYLDGQPTDPAASPGAMWTCPMHPQIRRDGPGTCPICGMALEPEEPSLDDAPNPELVDFTRRTWVAVLLAVPLLAISMLAQSARSCDFGQVEERTLNA